MANLPDYYEILQVSPNADEEVVHAAYRRLVMKWHPDRNPGDPVALERMKLLNAAFDTISSPQTRREYDAQRGASAATGPAKAGSPKTGSGGQPKAEPAEQNTPPASPTVKVESEQEETRGRVAWLISAIGVFLFLAGYGPNLFTEPGFFLGGCILWSILFGTPAYLCHRFKMFTGVTVVATLFFLAAAAHVAYGFYESHVLRPRIEALSPEKAIRVRPSDSTAQIDPFVGGSEPTKHRTPFSDRPPSDPSIDSDHFIQQGCAALNRGDTARAMMNFDEAIRTDPKSSDAYYFRGGIWVSQKDYDRAIHDYNETIRINPSSSAAYRDRAYAQQRKKLFARAVEDYEKAILLNSDEYPQFAYADLSWLLATCPEEKIRDGKRAVLMATRACELTSWRWGVSLAALAAGHAEGGQFDEAVRHQGKALEDTRIYSEVKDEYRRLLELYQKKKPYCQNH